MSTSLLYHGFGIRGYEHLRTEYVDGKVVFYVKEKDDSLRCVVCGSCKVWRRGTNPARRIKSLPIAMRKTEIVLEPVRVECLDCGGIHQIDIGFTEDARTYTRRVERFVAELCRATTIKNVAKHTGLSWGTVKDIHKRYLARRFDRPRLKELTHIAIDEICVGKPRRFLTLVLDLLTGAIVFVDDGKGSDSLKGFWKRLRVSGAKVQAVAIDMSPAYTKAIKENLSNAGIVYDRFHVIKLMNKKIDSLRRRIQGKGTEAEKVVLKGLRWLLLKNPDKLVAEKGEQAHLEQALALNKPLATAYYLKEDLRALWELPTKQSAKKYLYGWIGRAKASGERILKSFAKTIEQHAEGLLAYYDYFISSGPLEGTNNKVKTMQRQSFGLRDSDYFKLKLYSLHTTTSRLIGQL